VSRAVAVYALLLCALALPVFGATEGEVHEGRNWGVLALQVFNVGLLALLLWRFGRRPLHDFLVQRARSVAQAVEAADGRLRDARADLERARERIDGFDGEEQALLRDAEERAEAERRRTLERARAAADRVRDEARRVADQEIERARQELREEAAALAISVAGDLIRENLSPEDDEWLVREATERIGSRT
jgi:F-type H+-transporting ATPase subunit b